MVKLTDVCDFQGGSQPPKEEWSSEARDGYIRMLQIRDFTQSDRVTPEYIKISGSTKTCKADDVLIARYGASLGKILTGLSGAYNVAIMRTIPDETVLMKKYLYYYLNSPYFQTSILNVGSRAAQAGFNKDDLSKLDISCPPFEEQDKIVRILQKVDDVIEKRETELENSDKLIKARFVELFGDPLINPKGFPVRTIDEVSVLNKGITYSPEDVADEGIIVLRSSNIQGNTFDLNDLVKITKKVSPDKYVQENDILMCNRNGSARLVGKVAKIPKLNEDMTFGTFMTIVRSDIHEYLFAFFQMDAFREQIKFQTAVAINQISLPLLASVKVPIPPIELIEEFTAFTEQVDKSKVVEISEAA